MLFSDVKAHPLVRAIERAFNNNTMAYHLRKMPLMKMLVILNGSSIDNKYDLFIKTGEIERNLDHYFTNVYKGEKMHKEECDYMKCCMDIIQIYENDPFTISSFINILKQLIPSKSVIFKAYGSDVSFLGAEAC